jgi:hypothetical protein
MDLQTANLVPHSHPVSAWVRLMDPLAVDIDHDVEVRAIVDKVGFPVDPTDTYNCQMMSVSTGWTITMNLTDSSARSSAPWWTRQVVTEAMTTWCHHVGTGT